MVVSYRVKRYTKHGERELLSGMMFPQAATNTTFKSLLVSFFIYYLMNELFIFGSDNPRLSRLLSIRSSTSHVIHH